MDASDPTEVIEFRLEWRSAEKKALIGVIGSSTRAHEVLRRDHALSPAMIRRLDQTSRIPTEWGPPARRALQRLRRRPARTRNRAPH
jgi:antitoxin component HigA of HigAB toxin-antitoxin module